MHIKDISNEQCAQFVENYLSNIKNNNISSGPIKIQKVKRTDEHVQVFAKQRQKHLIHNTKLTQKYIVTFENISDETMISSIEMEIDKGVELMKLDISKETNQYFEKILQQTEESVLQK